MAPPDRSRTLRDAVGLGVAVGLYGIAFGAAADAAGLDAWQAMTLSLLMFTGASQFALVGVLGAGGSAPAAVGSALLLGTRNTVYGVRMAPLLAPRGAAGRAAAAHLVIDESTAMAVAAPDRELGRLAFWVTGGTVYLGWNAMTLVGALGASGLGGTAEAALDSVVPAAFLALLWPRLTARGSAEPGAQRRVALGGAVVALALTPFVPAGVQVIVAVVAVALAGRPRTAELPA
ncbi:AzlC family ABC transporter permease [Blastococcus sp. TML/M2B]|uniref:AzlC family ABC transporter permease n=1 Tax=unclassified Blastococcus TaxID=2619396 RepID=UPI00190D72F3|nr:MULTISPECIES: AzlC family ABC transporter permease [unclassified Blastococcus]MBN1091729.1 AzlC family ABC transporter permease [Blastococcus sp. TML/M2B]MBN1094710.1 AzlC family ABC transporter permease [Blastococcus sp. TML/C7B]